MTNNDDILIGIGADRSQLSAELKAAQAEVERTLAEVGKKPVRVDTGGAVKNLQAAGRSAELFGKALRLGGATIVLGAVAGILQRMGGAMRAAAEIGERLGASLAMRKDLREGAANVESFFDRMKFAGGVAASYVSKALGATFGRLGDKLGGLASAAGVLAGGGSLADAGRATIAKAPRIQTAEEFAAVRQLAEAKRSAAVDEAEGAEKVRLLKEDLAKAEQDRVAWSGDVVKSAEAELRALGLRKQLSAAEAEVNKKTAAAREQIGRAEAEYAEAYRVRLLGEMADKEKLLALQDEEAVLREKLNTKGLTYEQQLETAKSIEEKRREIGEQLVAIKDREAQQAERLATATREAGEAEERRAASERDRSGWTLGDLAKVPVNNWELGQARARGESGPVADSPEARRQVMQARWVQATERSAHAARLHGNEAFAAKATEAALSARKGIGALTASERDPMAQDIAGVRKATEALVEVERTRGLKMAVVNQ